MTPALYTPVLELAPFSPASNLVLLALALLLEAAFGYPRPLYRLLRHPVVWIGALVNRLDTGLNQEALTASARLARGFLALGALLLLVGLPSILLAWWLGGSLLGVVVLALLASTLLAQRSLDQHVRAIAEGLDKEGLAGGRRTVAMIVGRNPETLDEAGVARAAIESLAENASDGVVAPAFWCAVGGLPGLLLYKAINTADSMIGHLTPRHAAFGFAAAKLDDLVNLPASRLCALWFAAAALLLPGASAREALRAVWRDAGKHRSPNAGWPEAAMAGALGLRLAGPRTYGTKRVEDHWMGDGRAEATAADIRRALTLYRLACLLQAAVVVGLAVLLHL